MHFHVILDQNFVHVITSHIIFYICTVRYKMVDKYFGVLKNLVIDVLCLDWNGNGISAEDLFHSGLEFSPLDWGGCRGHHLGQLCSVVCHQVTLTRTNGPCSNCIIISQSFMKVQLRGGAKKYSNVGNLL